MKNKKKYFIITIDTEGDNQWDLSKGISTENAKYLPRFQELAEKYGFKPVWLTNYEMANDDYFVNYMKEKQNNGLCEIGMHLHAWNNPPEYTLSKVNMERDYLIEYPEAIMHEKVKRLTKLLTDKFGVRPVSHRSGRWATNAKYYEILSNNGYLVDCSVTPHVDWRKCLGSTGVPGTNYSDYNETPYFIENKLLEVPMTIRMLHNFQFDRIKNIKNVLGELKRFVFGRNQWMRPDKHLNVSGLKYLIKHCSKYENDIMFMIHSSELMPGGSPNFKDQISIEKLYKLLDNIFEYVKKQGYVGITLKTYYNVYKKELEKK